MAGPTTTLEHVFDARVATFAIKANEAINAEEAYRTAYAQATLEADGKNSEARKAQADLATTEARLKRDRAALAKDVALHMVLHLRGRS